MKNVIDEKIARLREITSEFIFIEEYSHANSACYKILNVFTYYNSDKLVLCPVSDGIETALDLAIEYIGKRKEDFFKSEDERISNSL
ncbi:MAG: hypothetical protein ACOCV1_07975 [Bacillota bacterium]